MLYYVGIVCVCGWGVVDCVRVVGEIMVVACSCMCLIDLDLVWY